MTGERGIDKCGTTDSQFTSVSVTARTQIGGADRRAQYAADPADESSGLLAWGRQYLPEHFTLHASAMHRWLAGQLDAVRTERGAKINVVGPRGGAKSTIGTLAYVLRAAIEGWEPYIWIVSDSRHQANSHLDNVKAELTDNRRLADDYPQAIGQGPVWRGGAARLRNGVTIEAFGTGQRVRGRRRRWSRPSLIVCDDVQNDQHIQSALQRASTRRWFHGTLMKAGSPITNFVHLATALHRDALALELHRTPGWTSRIFAALQRWPINMTLWSKWESTYCDLDQADHRQAARDFYEQHRGQMDAGAEVLWPDREDLYALMCMRVEGGRTAFDREKQGSPLDPELCEWPEDYFGEQIWFDRWPDRLRVKTLALDPSKGSDSRRGDYSAFVMLGIDARDTIYLEADLGRRPTPQLVADGVELARRFQPDAFGVEANQFQELLAAEFEAEFRRRGMLDVRPWLLDNHVSKLVRIRRLGPYLATRRLQFKDRSPSTRLLVDQLKDFPAGDHDDGPDAAEMALRLAGHLLNYSARGDGLGDRLPVG